MEDTKKKNRKLKIFTVIGAGVLVVGAAVITILIRNHSSDTDTDADSDTNSDSDLNCVHKPIINIGGKLFGKLSELTDEQKTEAIEKINDNIRRSDEELVRLSTAGSHVMSSNEEFGYMWNEQVGCMNSIRNSKIMKEIIEDSMENKE